MDPVGELEELIRRAFAEGPETLDATSAATFLAQALAPNVVMRDQLEHVGWTCHNHLQPDRDLGFERECDECRPVFTIPPRVVSGTAHHVLGGTMGADA